jgi:glyoxylase-like metal-dependent hydrolase (beta-lactamase superfamily II)
MARAYSLYEGSFSVDSTKKFIPFDPLIHDKKDRPASLFIHVHPFLIETDQGLILLDTGLGFVDEQGELKLHQKLRHLGYEPKDVRYVLLSHLHKDHASGMITQIDGRYRLAFPEAEYVVQRGEWEDAYSGKSESYRVEILDVLQRSGNLLLVEGNGQINPEIRYELSGGHTEFHQVFHIVTKDKHFFFGGDEAPEPEQFFRSFAAKYDFNGRKAMELRHEYWEKGREENWIFLFYHSTNIAIGKAQWIDGHYRIIDVSKEDSSTDV